MTIKDLEILNEEANKLRNILRNIILKKIKKAIEEHGSENQLVLKEPITLLGTNHHDGFAIIEDIKLSMLGTIIIGKTHKGFPLDTMFYYTNDALIRLLNVIDQQFNTPELT